MSNILKFNNVLMQPTCTSYNPLNNINSTSVSWYYYYLNPSMCATNVPVTITTTQTLTLNIVVISPGGGGGQSISYAYGGGGGGGGVSLSQIINFSPEQSISVTFGTISLTANKVDTTFSYNNVTVSAGTGSYGMDGTSDEDTYGYLYYGGDGGNGSNTNNSSTNPYGSFAGGAGGNGGIGTIQNGNPGPSHNGATSGSVGNATPAYTPITMADGTTANVATAGSEGESGNQTTILFYFQLTAQP